MPLCKLLRSSADGAVYNAIPEVKQRYLTKHPGRTRIEVWKPDWHLHSLSQSSTLRIQGREPFRLRWTNNNWLSQTDTESTAGTLEIDYFDLPAAAWSQADHQICFTFFWLTSNRWEGKNYSVNVQPQA